MKDFYREHEAYSPEMSAEEYREIKRNKVLEVIKPICEAFEIEDYDYIINAGIERLIVEGQAICCSCNSIGATVNQLINYIWLKSYAKSHWICDNEDELIDNLKSYWIDKQKEC